MIKVAPEDFNAGELTEQLRQIDLSAGALVTFIGSVRDINEDKDVLGLSLEHYPGMTEKVLADISEKAKERFGVSQITIYHRVGDLSKEKKLKAPRCLIRRSASDRAPYSKYDFGTRNHFTISAAAAWRQP